MSKKRRYAGEETREFMYEADKYDVEFPIPPQEKNMNRKIKWIAIGALAIALITFAQTARAAGTEDVVLGAVVGFILGNELGKDDSNGSAGYIDLSKYNIQRIASDGTLVLTPIVKTHRKKVAEPPCARSFRRMIPYTKPPEYYWVPRCPNWTMPYGGLIQPDYKR